MECKNVVIKCECTDSVDIMIMKPIKGKVRIFKQGKGLSTANITVAGDVGVSGSCKMFGENCSGNVEVATSESIYSGTPYKITTIRKVG